MVKGWTVIFSKAVLRCSQLESFTVIDCLHECYIIVYVHHKTIYGRLGANENGYKQTVLKRYEMVNGCNDERLGILD